MNIKLILIIILLLAILFFLFKRFSNFKNDCNKTPYPIDIVYTWAGENNNKNDIRQSFNNELMYSLRSVFKYMPWFNKIYIVVNDEIKDRPSWFNDLYNNNIILVSQKSIFPKSEHYKLPCKVSDIIESYLNNIPQLSEHYIYLNDDFIINKELSYTYFYENDKILLSPLVKKNKKLNFNNNLKFKKYPYCNTNNLYHPHIPYAFTKTSFNNFLNEYNEWITWLRNCNYKKRIPINHCKKYGLNIPCQQLHFPYRIYLLNNNLGKINKKLKETYLIGNNKILLNIQLFFNSSLNSISYFVVNNINTQNKDTINNFLNKKFPKKLYFEK